MPNAYPCVAGISTHHRLHLHFLLPRTSTVCVRITMWQWHETSAPGARGQGQAWHRSACRLDSRATVEHSLRVFAYLMMCDIDVCRFRAYRDVPNLSPRGLTFSHPKPADRIQALPVPNVSPYHTHCTGCVHPVHPWTHAVPVPVPVPYRTLTLSSPLSYLLSLPLPVLGCVQTECSRTPFRPEPFGTVGNGGYIMMYKQHTTVT